MVEEEEVKKWDECLFLNQLLSTCRLRAFPVGPGVNGMCQNKMCTMTSCPLSCAGRLHFDQVLASLTRKRIELQDRKYTEPHIYSAFTFRPHAHGHRPESGVR